MNKRQQKNEEVKRAIIDAFFTLMRRRNGYEISVSDIVREADVARVSYYRNFNSKEDIVATLIDTAISEFEEQMDPSVTGFYCYKHVLLTFQMFYKYKEYIIDVLRFGYIQLLIQKLNEFHERMDGDLPASSIARYRIYAYMGALTNTAVAWIYEGTKETCEQISLEFCELVGIPAEVRL